MNKHIIGSFIGFSISMAALWGGSYLFKSDYWWSFPLVVTSSIFVLGGFITAILYLFEYVYEQPSQVLIKDYPTGIEDYYKTKTSDLKVEDYYDINNFGNCKEPK
mgnify:CR=1 FL=1